jgi:UDP-3-O-acyl-N-acetylglucosamine deacetylase
VVAHKGGHALHTALVTRLLRDRSLTQETTAEHVAAVTAPALAQPVASGD